jgi:hypothetical protein
MILPISGKYAGTYNGQEIDADIKLRDNNHLELLLSPKKQFFKALPYLRPKGILASMVLWLLYSTTIQLHLSGKVDVYSSSKNFPRLKYVPVSPSCYESEKKSKLKDTHLELCWAGDEFM